MKSFEYNVQLCAKIVRSLKKSMNRLKKIIQLTENKSI